MAKALFISTNFLKKKSIISGSVDPDKMLQFIETAQDMHIQNYLGTSLYNKLQTLIVDTTISDAANANYKLLLDEYIKPMLVWFSQAEFLPFAAYTLSETGLAKHRSENSDALTREEIAGLAARASEKASFYAERYLEYMCDNNGLYDEYDDPNQNMTPDKEQDSFGWYLG